MGGSGERNKDRIRIGLILGLVWIFGGVGWFIPYSRAEEMLLGDFVLPVPGFSTRATTNGV